MVVEHVLRWAINEFLLDHDDAEEAPWFVAHLGQLLGMLKRGEIKPRIAERIALDAVADAHTRIEKGGLEGKIVLVPNE